MRKSALVICGLLALCATTKAQDFSHKYLRDRAVPGNRERPCYFYY